MGPDFAQIAFANKKAFGFTQKEYKMGYDDCIRTKLKVSRDSLQVKCLRLKSYLQIQFDHRLNESDRFKDSN